MGDFADTFSFRAAGEARDAAKAADTNLNASLALLQMVNEMRDFQHRRFNDVIDGLNNRKHENDALAAKIDAQNEQIKNLQAQVAALQKRLYNKDNSKTPLKAMVR